MATANSFRRIGNPSPTPARSSGESGAANSPQSADKCNLNRAISFLGGQLPLDCEPLAAILHGAGNRKDWFDV